MGFRRVARFLKRLRPLKDSNRRRPELVAIQAEPESLGARQAPGVKFGPLPVFYVMMIFGMTILSAPLSGGAQQSAARAGTAGAEDASQGFKPPPAGAMVTQTVVFWRNERTGATFTAPTGGWQPPNADWSVVVDDVPQAQPRPEPRPRQSSDTAKVPLRP
jgi:hypothetical protein